MRMVLLYRNIHSITRNCVVSKGPPRTYLIVAYMVSHWPPWTNEKVVPRARKRAVMHVHSSAA